MVGIKSHFYISINCFIIYATIATKEKDTINLIKIILNGTHIRKSIDINKQIALIKQIKLILSI